MAPRTRAAAAGAPARDRPAHGPGDDRTPAPGVGGRVAVLAASRALGDAVASALVPEGFSVERLAGPEAIRAGVVRGEIDVVVLDIDVVRDAGFSTVRDLRDAGEAAILLLVERGPTLDRIRGLAAGADDYVFKPLGRIELAWRVRAAIGRRRASAARS